MKPEIWVIEDDDDRLKYIKYFLTTFGAKVNLKRYKLLDSVLKKEGRPDIIAVDTTQIGGRFPSYIPKEKLIADYRKFRCFVEKHTSSRFVVYCAVRTWADDFCAELIKDFKNSIVIEVIEGSPHSIAKRLYQISDAIKERK